MRELGHALKQYEPEIHEEAPLVRWHPSPLRFVHARFLYNIYPHDQSIWQCLSNPKWCLSFVLSVWPLWGLQPLYWLLVWFSFDRTDEYQLCNFIL
eukprot:4623943-Pleurochrysis_carterae.AAC.1